MHRSKLVLALLAMFALALAASQSHADTLATVTSFSNGGDGPIYPAGGLTLIGSTLYGTTSEGGANTDSQGYGDGTIFSVPVTGGNSTVLTSFNGTNGEGPGGSLTLSADGSTFYGTTGTGGAYGFGTVFSIPVAGGTPTVLCSLYGTDAYGSLTLSADGSTLYGMTNSGGANGYGSVFSVPVVGGTPTDLLDFNGINGQNPFGSLTLIGSTLYGTTTYGGANFGTYGPTLGPNNDGTVFSIPVTGGTPTTLFSFDGTNGKHPDASLTLSADGSTFYGTTSEGGQHNDGTVFSIPVTGGTLTTLGSFDGTNGQYPLFGSLTLSGSTLYGTTEFGGAYGYGTIFSIPVGGGTPTTLFSFSYPNGIYLLGGLTLGGSTLYGTTDEAGANGGGTVFSLPLPTPEPPSVVLLGMGAIGLGAMALRRRMLKEAV